MSEIEDNPTRLNEDSQQMLSALAETAELLASIGNRLVRYPTNVTT